jgi:hypothetical protein
VLLQVQVFASMSSMMVPMREFQGRKKPKLSSVPAGMAAGLIVKDAAAGAGPVE